MAEHEKHFKSRCWTDAMEYRATHTIVTLNAIKKYDPHKKLPTVLGVITKFTPNGFGDFLVTLADPYGVIDAAVHRSTVEDENVNNKMHLYVGSVFVLKNVSVWRLNSKCSLQLLGRTSLRYLGPMLNLHPARTHCSWFTNYCTRFSPNCQC